jgi:hypothetical protein
MNLSDNPNYVILKEWIDLRHLSQTLLLESVAALTAAIDNPTQEMVDEAKHKVAELNLITAELRELQTKRDN